MRYLPVWILIGILILTFSVGLKEYGAFCAFRFKHPVGNGNGNGNDQGAEKSFRMVLLADPQITYRPGFIGHVNNVFNDYYYSYVVSNIAKYLRPNVVAVLGDLFSYQSLPDDEFNARLERYRSIFADLDLDTNKNIMFLNVSGNHDIGYGSELDSARCSRFESAFGKLNAIYKVKDHVLGVLNSNNLDSSRDPILQKESWDIVDQMKEIETNEDDGDGDGNSRLILLTHIPLHKPYGNCVDAPEVILDGEGYVKTQNTLSPRTSQLILDKSSPLVIFTGHDHEGCFYRHSNATMEYTIRSMMAEYGGYAGIFDVFFDVDGEWSYEFNTCSSVNHFVVFGTFAFLCIYLLISLFLGFVYAFKLKFGSGDRTKTKNQ